MAISMRMMRRGILRVCRFWEISLYDLRNARMGSGRKGGGSGV